MKIVGKAFRLELPGPAEARRRARLLQEHLDRVSPFPRPRGFVFKARTWEAYEAWRRSQDNPRLW